MMRRDYGLLCTLPLSDLLLVDLRSHSALVTNLIWRGKPHALEEIDCVGSRGVMRYDGWARVV